MCIFEINNSVGVAGEVKEGGPKACAPGRGWMSVE